MMPVIIILKILCFIFTLLVFCIDVDAETYIFVGGNFSSLSEKTEDGDFKGIAVDIARKITDRLGHTATIKICPWLRAQKVVKEGKADVLMPPYKTPDREKWLDFSEIPIAPDKSFFFIRPASESEWDGNFSSIKGKKIGIAQGWSVGPEFDQIKKSLSVEYALTLDLCFKKLLARRIDMVPTQLREANASFERLGLTDEQKPVFIFPEVAINYNYFGFSKQKHKELSEFKKNFDLELIRMKENGEISKILAKYGMLY